MKPKTSYAISVVKIVSKIVRAVITKHPRTGKNNYEIFKELKLNTTIDYSAKKFPKSSSLANRTRSE